VGVLDRAVAVLDAVEAGARTFTQITTTTGLTRPTAHRLIRALEDHGFLRSAGAFGYRLGPRLMSLARTASGESPLRDLARPALERLAEVTGESAQLYVRSGDVRVCVDAVESKSELRTIVRVGAHLPLTAGSAGKVFMAWAPQPDYRRLVRLVKPLTERTPTGERLERQLHAAYRLGWASSSGERERAVGSVSAPVIGVHGALVAVVSVSGPESRLGRLHAKRHAPAVTTAAREIEQAIGVMP